MKFASYEVGLMNACSRCVSVSGVDLAEFEGGSLEAEIICWRMEERVVDGMEV